MFCGVREASGELVVVVRVAASKVDVYVRPLITWVSVCCCSEGGLVGSDRVTERLEVVLRVRPEGSARLVL